MTRRTIIRRVERLERQRRRKEYRFQFTIDFIEPDGTVASTIVWGGEKDKESRSSPSRNRCIDDEE
jgi:hypothetical protein